MTKAELTREIAQKTGLDHDTVLAVIEQMMLSIKDSIIEGDPVFLRGFGTFGIKQRAEKTARNIKAEKSIIIPAHNIPIFKPCPEFKNAMAPELKIKD